MSKSRVERIMRALGIHGCVMRRFRSTTDSQHDEPVAPNILNQEFSVDEPDRVWAGDITYIPTQSGWCYLAVILDLHTRMVVGWALADHMKTSLVEDALMMALGRRKPSPNLIHHSDRGSQYASQQYRSLLERHRITVSMSRRGNCYDNAVVESFFGTLKQELVFREKWENQQQAREALHSYIEIFYNRKRLHSSLDYRTPAEVDQEAA